MSRTPDGDTVEVGSQPGRRARTSAPQPQGAERPRHVGPWARPPSWLIAIAAAYLTLPVALFVLAWLQPITYPALAMLLVATAAGVRLTARGSGQRDYAAAVVAAMAGCAATVLSGIGGYPFAMKGDWTKHASIVNTLAQTGWPSVLGDGDVLRYYSGFYLVPAAVARAAGSDTRLLLAAWFAIGMAIGFALLLGGTRLRFAFPAVVVLFLMSGWDSVACALTAAPLCTPIHQEFWSGVIPVNAIVTGTLWRPHQIIPALILVPLVMGLRDDRRMPWLLIPLLVSCLFWGPFVVVGVAVLVAHEVVSLLRGREWRRTAVDWVAPALLAAPTALLVALYLTTGAAEVPLSFLWSSDKVALVPWSTTWGLVVALDVLPLVVVPFLVRGGLTGVHRVSVLATCALLLLVYGAFNDLVMNATLPFVVLFGWETAHFAARMVKAGPLLGPGPETATAAAAIRRRAVALRTVTAVVVFLAAQTAVVELTDSVLVGSSAGVGKAVGPVADWRTCFVGGDCILEEFRYQYQAPPDDFPSWLLRGVGG